MNHPRSIPFPYAESAGPALPGGAQTWLATLRQEALARFAETGLPSTRVEAWKYTNLKPLADTDLRPATDSDAKVTVATEALPAVDGAYRLVFVNGRYRPDLSATGPLPEGIRLSTVADKAAADDAGLKASLGTVVRPNGHAIANLNTAFLTDGCVLNVEPGAEVTGIVHLVFVATDGTDRALAHHPRNVIVAGEGSRATVVESHVAMVDGTVYWSNPVAEIVVETGAYLDHVKVQADSRAATHLAYSRARVAAGGHYNSFVMTLGAALSRNEIEVELEGEETQCHLNGVYLINGRQHADTTTFIDHAKPNCESREVYKGVLDGKAKGVFQGKIRVAPDAQKTNGHQLNRAILLSDEAEVSAKPELEIYADDVKCSHGATAGELDDESMFYLRSRGIPEAESRRLLVRAFVDELIDGIAAEPVRAYLEGLLDAWLNDNAAEGHVA